MSRKFVCLLGFISAFVLWSSLAEARVRHHEIFHSRYHAVGRHHGAPISRRHRVYRGHSRHTVRLGTPSHRHLAFGGGSGLASWYGGRGGGFTAAHRSLPFGTMVRVTNRANGRSCIVRINDRGPFIAGRVIDLSRVAARAIGVSGVSPVVLQRL